MRSVGMRRSGLVAPSLTKCPRFVIGSTVEYKSLQKQTGDIGIIWHLQLNISALPHLLLFFFCISTPELMQTRTRIVTDTKHQ